MPEYYVQIAQRDDRLENYHFVFENDDWFLDMYNKLNVKSISNISQEEFERNAGNRELWSIGICDDAGRPIGVMRHYEYLSAMRHKVKVLLQKFYGKAKARSTG